MSEFGDLSDRVALVTGAAGSIGSETALVLAEAGAKVVVSDLPGTALQDVAGAIRDKGLTVATQEADISDEASVGSLLQFALSSFGRLDVLVNNAGATSLTDVAADVMNLELEVGERAFAINARGTFLMTKHALPAMLENGRGAIVNVSSGTAFAGDARFTAYASSKGAVNTLTFYVATQYGHRGIRCNAIAPGVITGPLVDRAMPPVVADLFRDNTVVNRLGSPRDIAEAVLYLASDRSSYISGQILRVDGGFFAHLPTEPAVRRMFAPTQ